jgi:hypothetical protein
MLSRFVFRLVAGLCVWAAALEVAKAGPIFVGTESLGYTGTWVAFSDAALSKVVGSGVVAQHDMSVYFDSLTPQSFTQQNPIQSLYYAAASGNAFNNVNGFLGVYGSDLATQTSSGNWNETLKQFTTSIAGKTTGGVARFDPLGVGPGGSTGDFLSYSFSAVLGGLNGLNDVPAFTSSNLNPSSAAGSFNGIFHNTSGSGLYYAVNLDVNGNSSVQGTAGLLFPDGSVFSSAVQTPEPTSIALLGMSIAGLAGYRLRRRRVVAA